MPGHAVMIFASPALLPLAGFLPDHPEYINQVLSGKTKAQIKAIFAQFQSKYGVKFNDHLNIIFDDTFGYDSKGYLNVMSIVSAAR